GRPPGSRPAPGVAYRTRRGTSRRCFPPRYRLTPPNAAGRVSATPACGRLMGWARPAMSAEAGLARVLATLRWAGAGWQGSRRPFDRAAHMKPSDQQPPRRIAGLVNRFPRLSETLILNELLELRRQAVPLEQFVEDE